MTENSRKCFSKARRNNCQWEVKIEKVLLTNKSRNSSNYESKRISIKIRERNLKYNRRERHLLRLGEGKERITESKDVRVRNGAPRPNSADEM